MKFNKAKWIIVSECWAELKAPLYTTYNLKKLKFISSYQLQYEFSAFFFMGNAFLAVIYIGGGWIFLIFFLILAFIEFFF